MEACFLTFLAEVTWFWAPTQPARFFRSRFFLESRLSSESVEPFIDFLAYLEPKLCRKNENWVKIILPQTLTLGLLYP